MVTKSSNFAQWKITRPFLDFESVIWRMWNENFTTGLPSRITSRNRDVDYCMCYNEKYVQDYVSKDLIK